MWVRNAWENPLSPQTEISTCKTPKTSAAWLSQAHQQVLAGLEQDCLVNLVHLSHKSVKEQVGPEVNDKSGMQNYFSFLALSCLPYSWGHQSNRLSTRIFYQGVGVPIHLPLRQPQIWLQGETCKLRKSTGCAEKLLTPLMMDSGSVPVNLHVYG